MYVLHTQNIIKTIHLLTTVQRSLITKSEINYCYHVGTYHNMFFFLNIINQKSLMIDKISFMLKRPLQKIYMYI